MNRHLKEKKHEWPIKYITDTQGIQNKTRYHTHTQHAHTIKKSNNANLSERMCRNMNFHALLIQYKSAQPLRKATCQYPINLKIDTTYNPAILLLENSSLDIYFTEICTRMLTTAICNRKK